MTPKFPQITPIIPVRRQHVFDHADWVYELKYDGFRALAYVGEGRCRLVSRKGNELRRFETLCGSIPAEVKASNAVIDGEVVALGPSGMPAFYDLLKRRNSIVYFAFDLFWLDGEDFANCPCSNARNSCAPSFPASLHGWAPLTLLMGKQRRCLSWSRRTILRGRGRMADIRRNTKWYNVLNLSYSQRIGREELFQWSQLRGDQ